MEKNHLRKKYLEMRARATEDDIDTMSLAIANQCLQLPVWQYSNYHIFLSIKEKKEINTDYLLHILQGKDKNIIVPKTNSKTQMLDHFLLTDNTVIEKNNWGIPEPIDGIVFPVEKIEVVFIPLLAFDREGNRVGYGKGFYDKFLSQCKNDVLKIGLSIYEAEEQTIDIQDTDVPLDFCVTPNKVYSF